VAGGFFLTTSGGATFFATFGFDDLRVTEWSSFFASALEPTFLVAIFSPFCSKPISFIPESLLDC
jgi:hypothetical protein